MPAPTHLAVGLLKKPHGIKGDVLVYPVTDAPEMVFTKGRRLAVMDRQGALTGEELEIAYSRAYHRAWLLHFKGYETRESLETLRDRFLGQAVGEGVRRVDRAEKLVVITPPEGLLEL